MSQQSRPLGLYSTPEIPIPQFANWVTNLRVVSANDTNAAAVPDGECINLAKAGENKGSRFALNTISILVALSGGSSGGTLTLYIKDGSSYYLAAAPQAFTENKLFVFKDLPPLKYVPVITSMTGTITLHGGGTI